MRKRKFGTKNLLSFVAVLVFSTFSATAAHAAGTMVVLSSAVYSGGYDDSAVGVAVDGSDNIIVTGESSNGSNCNYMTIKYDKNLIAVSSVTYGNGYDCYPVGVATDSSGNIIVTGYVGGSNYNMYTIKYDKNLNVLCSKEYDSGAADYASGVAVDGSGNIIVTGYTPNGSYSDYFTVKYDSNLNVISSVTYNSGRNDEAYGVAVDGAGNIFVTGIITNGSGTQDFFTVKYDSNLHAVATAGFDGGNDDVAYGVAVDGSGNVIVTGLYYIGATPDFFTVKYDNNLAVISSATYNTGGYGYARGMAVDDSGNIIVAGRGTGGTPNYLTVKYDSNLHVISTATYDGGSSDEAKGVAVDSSGNIVVVGYSRIGALYKYCVIKYCGSPAVTSVSPAAGAQSQTLDVAVTGTNFTPGATVAFGGTGITVNSVTRNSLTSLTANVTISSSAATGKRSITVTNADSTASTKANAFMVLTDTSGISTAIDPASAGTLNLYPASGVSVTISFPVGTFSSAVTMTAKAATAPSDGSAYVKLGNICFELSNNLSLQPLKDVMVIITYNDSDITGIEESKLTLCRYDNGKWVEMPSVVDAVNNTITVTINHFSTFALAQILAATDLSNVKVYPNPFNPKKYAQGLTIANLTAEATLKIYNVAGELIAKPTYSDGGGEAHWYGKNDSGNSVASGVYLLFIDSPQGKKKMKVAVEK